MERQGRIGDRIVRRPRRRDLVPVVTESLPDRRPARILSPAYILFYSFAALVMVGGVLLLLPVSNNIGPGAFTPIEVAFFTSVSAVTVTGHVVVNTGEYWSDFGHVVIFTLMLLGGLGFTTMATFFLIMIGQRITLPERMLMRDTIGVERLGGIIHVLRNIVFIVLSLYFLGMALIWWQLRNELGLNLPDTLWHSAFLSVSSFNNAGFSILPNAGSLENFAGFPVLLTIVMALIIIGSIGWTTLVDVFRQRRFSRFTLDTKLVVVASLFLWFLGGIILFTSEFDNAATLGSYTVPEKGFLSLFHSVSGRTAGLTALDFSSAKELTLLFYPFLMFVGGAAGSVAGGIKVATLAVIIAAVISSIRGRSEVEAFGREVPHFQVHRAVSVAALGMTFVFLASLTLVLTEEGINFLRLYFDTVSAFGTTGLSTGVPPELSLAGKIVFMVAMFLGRLGPLTMALALTSGEDSTQYRYVQERVKIG